MQVLCILRTKPRSDFTWHKVSCKALFSVSSQISCIFSKNEPFFKMKIYWHGSIVFWQAIVHIQRYQHLTGMKSSIFWDITCVVCWKSTDTSDNTSCPPSRLKSTPSKETSMKLAASKQWLCLLAKVYSSNLTMDVTHFSETSTDFQWTTWYYTPEDKTVHNQWCMNLKSCITGISAYSDYMIVANTIDSQKLEDYDNANKLP
jgi:hypothetical protein